MLIVLFLLFQETALYTERTLNLKHKLHEEKLKKGILDLEPLEAGAKLIGAGVGAGVGLIGVAVLIREVGKFFGK